MTTAERSIVSVGYRPLRTMDELHVLILAAVAAAPEAGDVGLLQQVFSLPAAVVSRELTVLAAYGLVERADRQWSATGRGLRIVEVWNALGGNHTVEIPATGRQWLLGPGEFSVDEMIADGGEVATRARTFGVAEPDAAVKFLNERRAAAEKFDSFVRGWPPEAADERRSEQFGETPLFKTLTVAETDEALNRLDELLNAQVHAVISRREEAMGAAAKARGGDDSATKALRALKSQGQQILKKFDGERQGQRRRNRQLAAVQAVCEAYLAGQWLAAGIRPLADVFESEPASFTFYSTVPLYTPKPTLEPRIPNVSTLNTKQDQDGMLRSLFRWLFG